MNRFAKFFALFALFFAFGLETIWAQTLSNYQIAHSFTDGTTADYGITVDSAGNVYGLNATIKSASGGYLWKLTPGGTFSHVHDFGGTVNGKADGYVPVGRVSIDPSGNLWGVTHLGGQSDCGVVWEISNGTYSIVHDFNTGQVNALYSETPTQDGTNPEGGVAFDGQGNVYGVTQSGGANNQGTVWVMIGGGPLQIMYAFGSGEGGQSPDDGLVCDAFGNLFGIAQGGANGACMIWEIPSFMNGGGNFVDLHDFGGQITYPDGTTGRDGIDALNAVTLSPDDGAIYGCTIQGGEYDGGNVWKISNGNYTDLHDFGHEPTTNLLSPFCSVCLDSAGNLFGSVNAGGKYSNGAVWELTAPVGGKSSLIDLYDFKGGSSDGAGPAGALVIDTTGNLFGTTESYYGSPSNSTFWKGMVVPALTNLVVPGFVAGGTTQTGTVTVNGPAPKGGLVVSLSASGTITIPTSVTIPAGQTSASFSITVPSVTSTVNVTVTATANGVTQQAGMEINPNSIQSLKFSPGQVTGGQTSTLTVNLDGKASAGGLQVSLSSSSGDIQIPSTVTVPSGQSSLNVSVQTSAIYSNETVTVTASGGFGEYGSPTANLSILAPQITSVSFSPPTLTCGSSAVGTVRINGPAPSGGLSVTLSATSSVTQIPSSISVPSGATSVTFPITTLPVLNSIQVTIRASSALSSQKNVITVNPASLQSVGLNPGSGMGGTSSTGTVTLSGTAPPGGLTVNLSSNNSSATVPATVVFSYGDTSKTFTLKTVPVATDTTAIVTGTVGSTSEAATFKIFAPTLSSVVLTPTIVLGGTNGSCTVNLVGVAPTGGMQISMSSNSSDAVVPTTVTVPAGKSSVTFSVSTVPVSYSTACTLKATLGTTNKTGVLTLSPPALVSISLSPSTVPGGFTSTATVTLSGPAGAKGASVALKSSSSSAPVPATVYIPAGASSAKFTITTAKVTASVSATITGTLNSATATATLTITP